MLVRVGRNVLENHIHFNKNIRVSLSQRVELFGWKKKFQIDKNFREQLERVFVKFLVMFEPLLSID